MDKPKYKEFFLSSQVKPSVQMAKFSNLQFWSNMQEIKKIHDLGVEVAIVIGGGNIFRGASAAKVGIDRVQGDYGYVGYRNQRYGNSGFFERRMFSFDDCCQNRGCLRTYDSSSCYSSPRKGRIIILSAGTGNPYFTTDSAAALRAIEIEADVVLKGTRVDGVYTADPEKDPTATRYSQLSFAEALGKGLKIMDATAFTLCQENKLPIIVFDMNKPDNLTRLVQGEDVGTFIS
jgi:uridylate kinase